MLAQYNIAHYIYRRKPKHTTMNLRIVLFPPDDRGSHVIVEYGVTVMSLTPEQFKRLILHPNSKLAGVRWSDAIDCISNGFETFHVCSNWVSDALLQHPDEIERIFKRCFQGIAPELAGLEIRDVNITVYHPSTQES
jgi:hypothetical protein